MRLDILLATHYGFTRNKAQMIIESGLILVDKKTVTKPSFEVNEKDKIQILEDKRLHWVSRSAEKLHGFVEEIKITNPMFQIHGKSCLDVGSSTGGFSQVLLEYGAGHIDAVDVGKDQLHESLRSDGRISSFEEIDIREFKTENKYDIIVCDASFISLTKILPSILLHVSSYTDIILLYKPQFEVGRENLRKTGVPKDAKVVEKKLLEWERFIDSSNCYTIKKSPSILTGEAGNQEWVYWIKIKD